jgi:hypothetical protein
LLAAATGLASLPLFASLPQTTILWRLLHDTAHAPVFGALAVVLLALRRRPGPHYAARDYAWSWVLAAALGGAVELVQIPIGRDAEWVDLLRDGLGALTGLGLAAGIGLARGAADGWRRWLLAAGIAAGLALAAPVAWALAAYHERHAQFPVIADFDSRLDLYFVSGGPNARRTRVAGAVAPALRVELGSGLYPGVTFEEPWPDWSGSDRLEIDVTNAGSAPLGITVRVHDRRHDQAYEDRYNEHFVLAPGRQRLVVPLERIARAPRTRRLDLQAVAGIVIFADAGEAGRILLLHRIALARAADGGPAAPPAATLEPAATIASPAAPAAR